VESGLLVSQTKDIVPNVINDIAEQPVMLESQRQTNLMMSFVAPSPSYPNQSGINTALLLVHDAKLGVSTNGKRELRAG